MFGRGLLFVLLILILAGVAGVGYLGMYPPHTTPKAVERVIPNDKFQGH